MQAKVMRRGRLRKCLVLPGVMLLGLLGCSGLQRIGDSEDAPQSLPWIEARLGDRPLNIMVARSDFEKRTGLMFRRELRENEGMLFENSSPSFLTFWMKNTWLPLDLVFFSPRLEVTEWILDLKPGMVIPDEDLPLYQSRGKAQYALEVPSGSVARWKLRVGERLSF